MKLKSIGRALYSNTITVFNISEHLCVRYTRTTCIRNLYNVKRRGFSARRFCFLFYSFGKIANWTHKKMNEWKSGEREGEGERRNKVMAERIIVI